ncbi:2-hydroxyacid dehydrogenase [Aquabacter spiritensis]|uniref:Lactate dehydrogenase-like 2-hydroxyacid dehydrogenase n=1 Tax=Aquabacter spiritensis TaxID=933073 RepID=A0A4R3M542_9HYPH|nr:2-hydroxyacid dehydrogenase [Aquabacter spiritensis]TCT08142.1 lactate dehydrogenase-like 2-hydroxyacid dehydrogenase [Aquabacter spiritensis]
MTADPRPVLLLTGTIMDKVVEPQLMPQFQLIGGDDVEGAVAAHGAAVRGVVTRGRLPVTDALMARLPKLEIVANFGVGYDTVDAAAAARRGVVVTNTPDVLNEEVADLTLGLLLATVREIPQSDRYLRAGKWASAPFPLGATLRDRSVGLVGMGRIGQAIARRLAAFGLPIAYHSRNPAPDVPYRHYPNLADLARDVDTLILILPGGPATRGLVDAEILAALGPRGILINVARGSVVDEPALIAALEAGTILAAGLDVFADEPNVPEALRARDNVVLLPHVGSATHFTRAAMGQLVVDNLRAWFKGAGPVTPVAETPWPPRGA